MIWDVVKYEKYRGESVISYCSGLESSSIYNPEHLTLYGPISSLWFFKIIIPPSIS